MSRRTKFGLLLAMVLLAANVAMALRSWQESEVEWDPVNVWDGPQQQTAEMLGDFILGTPITALITLGILRSRREKVAVRITG